MTNYARGRAFEYRVRDYYRERNCFVVRSAGSHSPVDLVAFSLDGEAPSFVQCKRDGRLPLAEKKELHDLAHVCGAVPILAYQLGHKLMTRELEATDMAGPGRTADALLQSLCEHHPEMASASALKAAEALRKQAKRHLNLVGEINAAPPAPPALPKRAVEGRLTVTKIIGVVADYYGISVTRMLSMNRRAHLVKARQVAAYLARELTAASFPIIARKLNHADHTTALYGATKIADALPHDGKLQSEVTALFATLGHHGAVT